VDTRDTSYFRRPIPLAVILLITVVVHGPLLFYQLPIRGSYDANFHIFMASHYAHHWFDPWNEKWFAGFSQTTYPPLGHQWIAMFSYVTGLNMAYLLVQFMGILLLPVAVFRFARLWVNPRAASYAALLSVFLGTVVFLVYSAGQLSTTVSAPLWLLALPYLYEWLRWGRMRALLKGLVLALVAASVHHVTLLFGAVLFALPVLWLAWMDRRGDGHFATPTVLSRAAVFAVLSGVGIGLVLLPYWISIFQHPIEQVPIPHASRSNFLLSKVLTMEYFIVPYGAMIVALPFIFFRGMSFSRLRPLLLFFWIAFIFGMGGTTPIPHWVLGRAFEILTFERFTLMASLLALPIVGLLVDEFIERFRTKAAVAVGLAAAATFCLTMSWMYYSPFKKLSSMDVDSVVNFLNRDGHDKYRYITLGFGNALPKVSTYANAGSVDGEYNSARLLPEMTQYGSAQLTSAKFFGRAGMDSLRAMLNHANRYGLKYIFVHDPYYNPLLSFAGWREVEVYDGGQIHVWSKEDVPPARKIESDAMPAPWEGFLWGILPMGCSILAILLALLIPDRVRSLELVPPATAPAGAVYAREAR
jgi:6-pyruvoyl-tetrahydropterin synthase related domain